MPLSDPSAIEDWVRARGGKGDPGAHDWTFIQNAPDPDDPNRADGSLRAVCRACGLIRRKPLSQNSEMFIDLSGPCPGDSGYWKELQEQRVGTSTAASKGKRR